MRAQHVQVHGDRLQDEGALHLDGHSAPPLLRRPRYTCTCTPSSQAQRSGTAHPWPEEQWPARRQRRTGGGVAACQPVCSRMQSVVRCIMHLDRPAAAAAEQGRARICPRHVRALVVRHWAACRPCGAAGMALLPVPAQPHPTMLGSSAGAACLRPASALCLGGGWGAVA